VAFDHRIHPFPSERDSQTRGDESIVSHWIDFYALNICSNLLVHTCWYHRLSIIEIILFPVRHQQSSEDRMNVSHWIETSQTVISAALACHKFAGTSEVAVLFTYFGMYGRFKINPRSPAPWPASWQSKLKGMRRSVVSPDIQHQLPTLVLDLLPPLVNRLMQNAELRHPRERPPLDIHLTLGLS
jgi:hypothetical protein